MQDQISEPILNITDYLCWAVQRLLECGESRFYNFMKPKMIKVIDLYSEGGVKIYTPEYPMLEENAL